MQLQTRVRRSCATDLSTHKAEESAMPLEREIPWPDHANFRRFEGLHRPVSKPDNQDLRIDFRSMALTQTLFSLHVLFEMMQSFQE